MERPAALTKVVTVPFSLRRLMMDDVAAVAALAARCPEAAQWSCGNYERACGGDLEGWVATTRRRTPSVERSDVVGFLIARCVADEMEVLNLAVEAAFRRCGIATGLLNTALEFGRASGAKRAFLEVRVTNVGAIAFYEARGFVCAGRRPGYYSDPPEDALILSRALS